jgi:nucleoside 2-deoxyribosyltransferase
LASSLRKLGFLEEGGAVLVLSAQGWHRVGELQTGRASTRNAFVAMDFSPDLDSVYEKGIRPAIEDAGFTPIHMGRLHHVQRIDDRILVELKRCLFVVADFTNENRGAYFEAGYAQALGKTVIWTARKGQTVHFDTRQYNHIFWESESDLRERLRDRILALIL